MLKYICNTIKNSVIDRENMCLNCVNEFQSSTAEAGSLKEKLEEKTKEAEENLTKYFHLIRQYEPLKDKQETMKITLNMYSKYILDSLIYKINA